MSTTDPAATPAADVAAPRQEFTIFHLIWPAVFSVSIAVCAAIGWQYLSWPGVALSIPIGWAVGFVAWLVLGGVLTALAALLVRS